MTRNLRGSSSRIAWSGGERGSIPIEGGVDVAFRREIAKTEDPVGRPAVVGARFHVVTSRFHAAEAFRVEDISGLLNARQQVVRALARGIAEGTSGPATVHDVCSANSALASCTVSNARSRRRPNGLSTLPDGNVHGRRSRWLWIRASQRSRRWRVRSQADPTEVASACIRRADLRRSPEATTPPRPPRSRAAGSCAPPAAP